MLNAIFIILGFVILIIGNQLPWLFVACVGFIAGYTVAQQPQIGLSGIPLIMFSSGFALIGGLLVIYIKRIMLILAGFLGGVYICQHLPPALGWTSEWITWYVLLIVGITAAVLIYIWQSLALIFVSSLAGTTLVIQYIQIVRNSQVLGTAPTSVSRRSDRSWPRSARWATATSGRARRRGRRTSTP